MPILHHRHFSLGTVIYALLLLCLIGGIVSYVLFQARHIIEGPLITLDAEPTHMQSGTTVTLVGTAENITTLSLNGRTIFTDDQGHFEETVVLPVGYTVVTLTAQDRYGRQRSLERGFVRS